MENLKIKLEIELKKQETTLKELTELMIKLNGIGLKTFYSESLEVSRENSKQIIKELKLKLYGKQ